MKEVLVPSDVIYKVEDDWLSLYEWEEAPNFWTYVKEYSGLDGWRFNFEQEQFHCDIRDKKKATIFILRWL